MRPPQMAPRRRGAGQAEGGGAAARVLTRPCGRAALRSRARRFSHTCVYIYIRGFLAGFISQASTFPRVDPVKPGSGLARQKHTPASGHPGDTARAERC